MFYTYFIKILCALISYRTDVQITTLRENNLWCRYKVCVVLNIVFLVVVYNMNASFKQLLLPLSCMGKVLILLDSLSHVGALSY
jgi:hypothetical protein